MDPSTFSKGDWRLCYTGWRRGFKPTKRQTCCTSLEDQGMAPPATGECLQTLAAATGGPELYFWPDGTRFGPGLIGWACMCSYQDPPTVWRPHHRWGTWAPDLETQEAPGQEGAGRPMISNAHICRELFQSRGWERVTWDLPTSITCPQESLGARCSGSCKGRGTPSGAPVCPKSARPFADPKAWKAQCLLERSASASEQVRERARASTRRVMD